MYISYFLRFFLLVSAVWYGESNYWEDGNGNSDPPSGGGTTMPFTRVQHAGPTISSNTSLNTFSNISCGEPSETIAEDNPGQLPQSVLQTIEECNKMFFVSGSLQQAGEWQKMYDTLKYYVEHCTGTVKTYDAFSGMNGANYYRSTDPNRFPLHLTWLKKVLYYDPDTLYYCEDVFSMLKTFRYFDSAHVMYTEGAIAVAQFLVDSAHCDYLDETIRENIKEDLASLYKEWKDTVKDSIATPFNPIIPTIDDLGLRILRGPQNSVAATTDIRIGKLQANPNPFRDELDLSYLLEKSAMVHIAIYDALGKLWYSAGEGFKQTGEHTLTINAKSWIPGSYYVRLSAPSGEVKTVKVIKE